MTNPSIDSSVRRPAWLAFPMMFGLVLLFAAGAIGPGASSAAAGSTVVVTMTDDPPRFVPEKVTINAGDTVEWDNTGKVLHSATNNPTFAINKADASVPAGTKPFNSGFMTPGAKFSYKFTVAGTYKYICLPHQKDGMIGEITVKK
jgi:plastocyanin